jgi:SH3 domain-containing protein
MWRLLGSRAAAGPLSLVAALSVIFFGVIASAAPGDVHKVTVERANLRAGPSDKTDALGQVQRGGELIELQRQGDWLGVRVVRTGEEGWVYGNLVELSSATRLGREMAPAGFKDLSPGFDSLVRSIEQRYGYQMFDRVEITENRTLRVIPTRDWLIYGSRQDHLLAALALYEMWKNNQKDQPVNLALMDEKGGQYITISDAAAGPSLTIHSFAKD